MKPQRRTGLTTAECRTLVSTVPTLMLQNADATTHTASSRWAPSAPHHASSPPGCQEHSTGHRCVPQEGPPKSNPSPLPRQTPPLLADNSGC